MGRHPSDIAQAKASDHVSALYGAMDGSVADIVAYAFAPVNAFSIGVW